MDPQAKRGGLSAQDMQAILAVTRALAAPFDLTTMLAEVVNAAKQVLGAERVDPEQGIAGKSLG
jgi:hypothetical protein